MLFLRLGDPGAVYLGDSVHHIVSQSRRQLPSVMTRELGWAWEISTWLVQHLIPSLAGAEASWPHRAGDMVVGGE